jgi:putative ABC transport system substrate-binding protein
MTALAAVMAWVSAARGQEPRPVIGYLNGFTAADAIGGNLQAFYHGLKTTGFVVGKNVTIEFRWADGHYDRPPALAAELVGRNVSVIHAPDLPSALAAKATTKTIPIVFVSGADPVKVGLVESFSRPNGNATGMTGYFNVAGSKRVELLHELLPEVKTIALLGNPNNPNFQPAVPDIRVAADALKQHLYVLKASTE